MEEDKLLDIEKLAQIKWKFIHKRHRTPLYNYILWNGISKHYNKSIDFPYEMNNWLSLDGDLMVELSQWQGVQQLALEAISVNPKFLLEITQKAYELNGKIVEFVQNVQRHTDIKSWSNDQIAETYDQYIKLNLQAASFMVFPMFFDEYLEGHIKDEVVKLFEPSEIEDVMQILTTSSKIGPAKEEQIALLELAAKLNHRKLEEVDIQEFILDFGWLKNAFLSGDFYDLDEVRLRIEELAKNEPEKQLENIKNERELFLKKLNDYKSKVDEKTQVMVDVLQEAIYFRGWRTERIYRNAQYMNSFFVEVSKRIGINNFKDFFFLIPPEALTALRGGKIDQDLISERKKSFILFADGVNTDIFSGSIVEEVKEKVNYLESVGDLKVIKGRCAFPGQIKGKVLIITSKDDFNKMKPGYILVSHSTTPDYVPIIGMALAIITDEGGILSHAAIISRELQIPCVIGTLNATKILSDEAEVEMDADRGMIKIIKVQN